MKETKRWARPGPLMGLSVSALVVCLVLLTRNTSNGAPERPNLAPVAVQVAETSTQDVALTVNALGTVVANQSITLTSMISGRLQAVYFTEGQAVKQGQLLAQIDTRSYQASKAQYLAEQAQNQALLTNARQTLARYQRLYADKSLAQQDLQTQIATVAQYQGAVEADRAQVEAAQVNIDYGRITAPSDGYLGLRLIDPGNTLNANDTQIVTLTQTKPIAVTFSIPEKYLGQIRPVIRAGGSLPVQVLSGDGQSRVAKGEVRYLNNQIDSATGSVTLKAIFANDDDQLFPNQYVQVQLALGWLRNAVVVPEAAVQLSDAGPYVFRVGPDAVVQRITIDTGPNDGQGGLVVTQGLQPGQSVVTRGVDRLREGTRVQVVTAAKDQAASP